MTDVDVFSLPNDEEIKRLEIIMEESLANPGNSIDEEELVNQDRDETFDLEHEESSSSIINPDLAAIFTELKKNNSGTIVNKPTVRNPELEQLNRLKNSNNYELIDVDKIDKALDNIINNKKKSELDNDTLLIKFKKSRNTIRHKELSNNYIGSNYDLFYVKVYGRTYFINQHGSRCAINFELDEFEEFNSSQINELVNDNYCLYYEYGSNKRLYVPQSLKNATVEHKVRILCNSDYPSYKQYIYFNDNYYLRDTTTITIDSLYKVSDISNYTIKTLKDIESSEEFVNKKESVEAVLNNLFGDNWYYIKVVDTYLEQILYERITRLGYLYITYMIKFPEINITNSKGDKHTIKNMFVSLDFDINFKLVGKMKGFKTTFSAVEIVSNYVHSHLHTKTPKGIQDNYSGRNEFCLGIGQPIELSIFKLNNSYSEELFTSLCMQLESYLSWESLEGTPYVKINTLVKQTDYRLYTHNKLQLNDKCIKRKETFELIKNKCFEYYIADNKIKIKNIVKNDRSDYFINTTFKKIYVNNNQYYKKNINSSTNLEEHNYVKRYKLVLNDSLDVCNNKHEPTKLYNTYVEDDNNKEYQQVENHFEIRDFLDQVEYLIN
jgi:hypothetical protein